MKYLKLFQIKAEREAFELDDTNTPNVNYCEEDESVQYVEKIDPTVGHAYVDLGLPSGTLWATCNVGANTPEEGGLMFQFGNSNGWVYGDASEQFQRVNPPITNSGKVYNRDEDLNLEDDPAHTHWGGGWRTPTQGEVIELRNRVTIEVTDGGLKLTSKINGNFIILPKIGHWTPTMGYIQGGSPYSFFGSSISLNQEERDIGIANNYSIDLEGVDKSEALAIRPVIKLNK